MYGPFGDLQCCFFVESALLRMRSSSTEVKFQLSVPNKLESAGCFGFLYFVFHYVVSVALTLK